MLKLKKGQFLYFASSKRLEQITKSSNNAESGVVRTFYDPQKREKEYGVKHIFTGIAQGTINLFEAAEITPDKIKELSA